MYKLHIELTARLCQCVEPNIGFDIPILTNNGKISTYLTIHCTVCGVQLIIPSNKLRARLSYPSLPDNTEPNKPKLTSVPEAKIIPFDQEKKDPN